LNYIYLLINFTYYITIIFTFELYLLTNDAGGQHLWGVEGQLAVRIERLEAVGGEGDGHGGDRAWALIFLSII
jgi:hypothetical protein